MRRSILLLAALVAISVGCSSAEGGKSDFPVGSTNIRYVGNGWVTFEWEGQCFLYHENGASLLNNYDRVLTKIDCKD